MKFGVSITFSVAMGAPVEEQGAYARRLARVAEEAGLDSVWFADRTVYPTNLPARHPERWGPGREDPEGQNVLEPVTALSFVGGATTRIRLGFSVLVLPFRHPVLNAKMITTLDVLSGGRVDFGVGVGWMPEEFEAMSADFRTRGAVTDEQIEMFKALCTGETAEYRGVHFQISDKIFFPKPLQQPHPPIWVGGNSRAAMRRVARLGDAWLPSKFGPEEFSERKQVLRQLCEENGRDSDSVTLGLSLPLTLGEQRRAADGSRQPLSGDPSEIAADLRRYEDAGVEYLVFTVASTDGDYTVDAINRFAQGSVLHP